MHRQGRGIGLRVVYPYLPPGCVQEERFVQTTLNSLRSETLKMAILPSQYFWLSSAFSSSNIRDIAQGRISKQIDFFIHQCGLHESKVSEVFDLIYDFLANEYRNEYVYKNEIINRIRHEKHDVAVSHIFSEFRTGKSRADLAVFNGTSTCYEIKTEIDTIRRLESQVSDYLRCFEHVYLVAPENKIDSSLDILQTQVGILVLHNDGSLHTVRKAESNIENIDQLTLFRSLQKKEYLKIASDLDETVIHLNEIDAFHKAKDIFLSLDIVEAHSKFMAAIQSRRAGKRDEDLLSQLPISLSNAFFSTKMTSGMWRSFSESINQVNKEKRCISPI